MFLFIFFLLLIGAFIIASGLVGLVIAVIVIDAVVFVQILRWIFSRRKKRLAKNASAFMK